MGVANQGHKEVDDIHHECLGMHRVRNVFVIGFNMFNLGGIYHKYFYISYCRCGEMLHYRFSTLLEWPGVVLLQWLLTTILNIMSIGEQKLRSIEIRII